MSIETEKGVIYDIKRYAIHDGPGIRTTIFLKGCPLDCWWCHNPESRLPDPEARNELAVRQSFGLLKSDDNKIGKMVSSSEVLKEIEKDTLFYDESGGGVTFSGGEPLMQTDFLQEMLRKCKKQTLHTAVDTSGYAPYTDFEKINDYVDLYLYDLKLMDDVNHVKYAGYSNHTILENLEKLARADKKIWLRIPLIPGITDTDRNLKEIIDYLIEIKKITDVQLLAYNRMGESKYPRLNKENRLGKKETQSREQLDAIQSKFCSAGFTLV